jgi:hypothetical protein
MHHRESLNGFTKTPGMKEKEDRKENNFKKKKISTSFFYTALTFHLPRYNSVVDANCNTSNSLLQPDTSATQIHL